MGNDRFVVTERPAAVGHKRTVRDDEAHGSIFDMSPLNSAA
jgi:hypothetical protein